MVWVTEGGQEGTVPSDQEKLMKGLKSNQKDSLYVGRRRLDQSLEELAKSAWIRTYKEQEKNPINFARTI